MSKLFIANCTKQVNHFHYRIPENPKLHEITIKPGSQAIVPGAVSPEMIDYIVLQHVAYGLVAANEIDRTKPFIGLCYSVDKEIRVENIMKALKHNDEVMQIRGYEQRVESAAAVSSAIDSANEGTGNVLGGMEMEVLEQPRGHERTSDDDGEGDNSLIAEKVVVDKSLPQARQTAKNVPRGAQRGRGR